MAGADRTVWKRGPRRTGVFNQLGALWHHRPFFAFLLVYNIKNAHPRAILGMVWLLIRPLVMVVVATILVRDTLGVGTDMLVPYPLYVLCGISCFLLFSRAVAWQTRLLYKLKRIMATCYVPRLVHYYSTLSPALVEFLVVLTCFGLGVVWYWVSTGTVYLAPPGQLVMVLPAMLLIVLWSQTMTLISSVLQLYAKDAWFTLRYVVSVLMVITPIFYPLSAVPAEFKTYLFFNPLTAPVVMYQWAMLDYGAPPWIPFGASLGVALLIYVTSLKFFVSWEGQALDEYI